MKSLLELLLVLVAVGAAARAAHAQRAIFLVRHGETIAPKGTDARPLSEAGQRRAELLAKLLKDAGIKAIFTSDLERTIKTAEPLA